MIDQETKRELQQTYQRHTLDTGSPELQIAVLTRSIQEITEHLRQNKKDNGARRGLLKQVSRRKKLMRYLQRKNLASYQELIKALGIRG